MNSLKKNLNYIIEDTAEKFAALDLPERILPEVKAVEEEIHTDKETVDAPKFKDANEILQAEPALLKKILTEIYSEAEKFFADNVNQSDAGKQPVDEIERWQEANGSINPKVLAALNDKVEWVENLQPSSKCEFDSTLHKALGAFRFYDFFSDVAEDFLTRLREAKAVAKKKVSDFKKLSAHAEKSIEARGEAARKELEDATPSAEENALAKFDVAKFERAVNSSDTKAKREHSAWLAQEEINHVNEKILATRQAYAENPPTVKRFISDAPADLVLPMGIYFDTGGGIRFADTEKAPGKNGYQIVGVSELFEINNIELKPATKYYSAN